MIELAQIRPYVEKIAYIISIILEMDVLICDDSLRILGDSDRKGNVSKDVDLLKKDSVISMSIAENRKVIYRNAKEESAGCLKCHQRSTCKTETIIAYPIYKGNVVYGGIGIYSQDKRQKDKLTSQEGPIIEFIENLGDLILTKLDEEEARGKDIIEKANELLIPLHTDKFDDIIGISKSIKQVKEEALSFSNSLSNVLILGESGTGKEVFAKAMHNASDRSKGPFVAVNCAAIPDNLIESDLFGYVEGAFTGASKNGRAGKFEVANHGTLFLDEIGEMPIHLQPKLLRALQERKIQRVGANKSIDIDIRIISATNRNLTEMMKTGEFREDLFYRLSVIPIKIPPLRERKNDVDVLIEYFLNMYKKMLNKGKIIGFEKMVVEVLKNYDWPGNIRELQNTVEYAVNRCKSTKIQVEDLPERIHVNPNKDKAYDPIPLRELEKDAIINCLKIHGTDKKGKEKAAQELGISRATLYRKIKEYEV